MKTNYLFPNKFKKWGWLLLIPSIVAGCLVMLKNFEPAFLDFKLPAIFINPVLGEKHLIGRVENNILNELAGIFLMISLILIAFSKEKEEDELISKIRLESLVWATYVNYAILLLAMLFIFGLSFLNVLVFNIFTLLAFFIIRFYWQKAILLKSLRHEE